MRKRAIFTLIALLILAASGCKEKEPPIDLAKVKAEAFQKNIESYPAGMMAFIEARVKEFPPRGTESLAIARFAKGQYIFFRKDTTFYEGMLTSDLYALQREGKNRLPNGGVITMTGKESVDYLNFEVKPFPTIWSYDKLKPVLEKYPLSVTYRFKDTKGGGYLHLLVPNYENFLLQKENYEAWNAEFEVIGPRYIVLTANDFILFGQECKPWKTRAEL